MKIKQLLTIGMALVVLAMSCMTVLFDKKYDALNPEQKERYGAILELINRKEYDRAIDGLKEFIREMPDFFEASRDLIGIYHETGDFKDAEVFYDSLDHYTTRLRVLAYIYMELEEFQKSYEMYLEYLDLLFNQKEINTEVIYTVYSNLDVCDSSVRDFKREEAVFQAAMDRGEAQGKDALTAACAGLLGRLYADFQGPNDKALSYIKRGYDLACKMGDEAGAAKSLESMGRIYRTREDFYKSINYYMKAFGLYEKLGLEWESLMISYRLGAAYIYVGDWKRAKENISRLYEISLAQKRPDYQALALGNFGYIEYKQDHFEETLEYCRQAEALLLNIKSTKYDFSLYRLYSAAYRNLGAFDVSREYSLKVLDRTSESTYNDKMLRLMVLGDLGDLAYLEEDYNQSEAYYIEILSVLDSIGGIPRYSLLYDAYFGLGQVYKQYGLYEKSLEMMEQAIINIESLRSRMTTDEFKLSYMETQIDVYDEIITLLLEMHEKEPDKGYRDRAFFYAESSKSRALLDLMILSGGGEEEIDLRYDTQILTLNDVRQEVLDENMVLLEYKQTPNSLLLWKITAENVDFFEFPIAKTEARQIVRQFHDNLQSLLRPGFYSSVAFSVYNRILPEVLEGLPDETQLLIVPDGPWQSIPFEALVTENTQADRYEDLPYLMKKYPVRYVQSATIMKQLVGDRGETGAGGLLAFGDPVFNKEDIVNETSSLRSVFSEEDIASLDRLVYSGIEVENISRFFEAKDVYTRETAIEDVLKYPFKIDGYEYIHFATHGIINQQNSYKSGLILTQDEDPAEDGILQMGEIFDLQLNARMVVLSACKTGLGESFRGEGLVNFTRAFMYAGADSVAVSLWNVTDRSTAELMTVFYEKMAGGYSRFEALREAKLSMTGEHPYYWAGFVLFGSE